MYPVIRKFSVLAFALIMITACAEKRILMPTPNLYVDVKSKLFGNLPKEFKSTHVELIYVTDRAPEKDELGNLCYGYRRSNSVAVRTTVIDLGENASWDNLVTASRTHSRFDKFELRTVSTQEFLRMPDTPTAYEVIDGKVVEDAETVKQIMAAVLRMKQEISRRLALTPRKEVFLYIHGYNNTFEDAAFALAALWHFFGREGLPIIYTWPAGHLGIFGYTYDRESSEFTVFHLKQTIKWLAEQLEIKKIHLIAHSRGTDVAISAFRELVIWARGAGLDPRQHFKIASFVMVAPDLDVQVIRQRISAERLVLAIGQGVLYSSPGDKAIGLAEILFASPEGRLGTLDISELSDADLARMKTNSSRITVVNFKGESTGYGHSYFRTNPAVSSDLVLMLRYGLKPGDPGRPLQYVGANFWRIPPGYPANAKKP